MLPERTGAAEDAFVRHWAESDDTEGLLEAIDHAMGERRPKLAARLVGLLDDRVPIEPGSTVARAQAAAKLLLVQVDQQEFDAVEGTFIDLEDAWREVRRDRMRRIKSRQRAALEGRQERPRRVGRRKKRDR